MSTQGVGAHDVGGRVREALPHDERPPRIARECTIVAPHRVPAVCGVGMSRSSILLAATGAFKNGPSIRFPYQLEKNYFEET